MSQNTNSKVLFVIPTLHYGGAERQLLELCRHINREKFQVSIVLLNQGAMPLQEKYADFIQNIPIMHLRSSGKYNVGKLFELIKIYKKKQPDIIHTFLPTANIWGCLAAKLYGNAISIASMRGLHYAYLDKWTLMNFISGKFLAQYVLVNSRTVERNCIRFLKIRSRKIKRIHNGVRSDTHSYDKASVCKSLRIPCNTVPIITTAGRIDRLKGIQYFVRMAQILVNTGIEGKFVIAGAGPLEKKLKDEIKKLQLDTHIIFLGEIADMQALLYITDVFVLPTLSEGCSNVILEAMAMGLPIVTTDIPGNAELIEHNVNGQLVGTKDPQALAQAVKLLIGDKQRAQRLGDRARTTVGSNYSMAVMTKNYEEYYSSLTKAGNRT